MPFIGEIAALFTALVWAIAVTFFRQLGGIFTPLNLNLWKGIISIAGLGLTLLFMSSAMPETNDLLWLLLSGLIGIGIGDTAFFSALNRMGERSTLLVAETLAPVFTAMLAVVWISEVLSATQWLAIAVILIGVDIVLGTRKRKHKNLHFSLSALSFAALAALCQAVGAVIGRDILTHSDIDPVTASLVRLFGGLALVVPLLIIGKQPWIPKQKLNRKTWLLLFGVTFLGTFLAHDFTNVFFCSCRSSNCSVIICQQYNIFFTNRQNSRGEDNSKCYMGKFDFHSWCCFNIFKLTIFLF